MTKNILKGKRTHDDFYLNEKTKVKEYYKFILSKVSKNLNNTDVIYSVITRLEMTRLQTEIQKIDSDAFIIMNKVMDLQGGHLPKNKFFNKTKLQAKK